MNCKWAVDVKNVLTSKTCWRQKRADVTNVLTSKMCWRQKCADVTNVLTSKTCWRQKRERRYISIDPRVYHSPCLFQGTKLQILNRVMMYETANMAPGPDTRQTCSRSWKMRVVFLVVLGCVAMMWFAPLVTHKGRITKSSISEKWVGFATTTPSAVTTAYQDGKRQMLNKMCDVNTSGSAPVLYHPGHGGHLGNKMFSMASLKGIGFLLNRTTAFHPSIFDNLEEFFPAVASENKTDLKKNPTGYFTVREKAPQCFDPARLIWSLPKDQPVSLERYLQSWKYFYCIQDDIKQLFTFDKDMTVSADRILGKLYKEAQKQGDTQVVTFVGVHIRMGSMLFHFSKNPKSDFRVAPLYYITAAMNYYRNKFQNVQFIICTDDLKWIEKHKALVISNDTYISTNRRPEEDMALLSRCNHSIMTVGKDHSMHIPEIAFFTLSPVSDIFAHISTGFSILFELFGICDMWPILWFFVVVNCFVSVMISLVLQVLLVGGAHFWLEGRWSIITHLCTT